MTYDEERALAQVANEAIIELRRRRRWKIFFRLVWLLIVLAIVARAVVGSKEEKAYPSNSEHVAVVEVDGVIAPGMPASAEDLNEALTDAFENTHSKAVILAINSPGGSPVQSGQVYRTIDRLKKKHDKKVYAVISDVGASGAYFIAAAADEIYADPASIVGSIGVISQSVGVEGLMDKLGIQGRTFKAGKYKDFLNPTKPLEGFEVAHMDSVLADVHQQFIDAVKAGRGDRLVDPKANNLFTGLFWSGQQAKQLGLVDGLASTRELVDELYGSDMETVLYSPALSPWQQLSRDLKSEVTQQVNTLFGTHQQVSAVLAK
ncbi:signal peptide peptidase SppA [Cardiobacteriaceae bacterium TAE3-ERU3]|nr:signal peptide peptidase SppA [Cardiobacteriaceae bacterium TAE3-ERU3]